MQITTNCRHQLSIDQHFTNCHFQTFATIAIGISDFYGRRCAPIQARHPIASIAYMVSFALTCLTWVTVVFSTASSLQPILI
jgi:hypothetical protein